MKVNMADAKNKLSKLIKAAENGQSVTICRRGTPVVHIIQKTKARRTKARRMTPKFGTLKGKVKINDPNWWKPVTRGDS